MSVLTRTLPLAVLVLLGGCETAPRQAGAVPATLPSSRAPSPTPFPRESALARAADKPAESWRIQGARPVQIAPTPLSSTGALHTVSLAFDQAPLPTVADAVITGLVHQSFRVDPDLAASSVTLRIAGRYTDAEVLALLAAALKPAGAVIVPEGLNSLAIVPAAKAPALSAPPSPDRPIAAVGPGVVVYTAHNLSAAELARLLTPLAGTSAQVRADSTREQLYLSGDSVTVNALLRSAQMFDVDWLKGLNFQFIPLQHASPAEMTNQLRRIFGGAQGPIGSQVEFIEVERLDAIIVIAKRPELLDQTQSWVERLDIASARPARRFRVVPLTNLVAESFVQTLSQLLNSRSGTTQGAGSTTGASVGASTSAAAGASAPAASVSPPPPTAAGDQTGLRVTADPMSNALVLFADDAEFQDVQAIVRELDVAPAQVLVEATVAEVTLNDELKYGVQFFMDQNGQFSGGFSSGTDTSASAQLPGFSLRYVSGDYRAVLNALSAVTDVQLVSTPRILVLSNQTAKLQVGDQVPIITQTAVSTVAGNAPVLNSVEYKDTGVVLTVTPRVGDHGRMFIDIDQEVSEVAGTTSSSIDSPTIQQRKFSTHVQVEDGQVIALGGLIRTNRTVGDTGIPFLRQAPIIGNLFNSRDRTVRQTELVVFLRPSIVRNRADADRLTDEIAARMEKLGLHRDGAR